MLVLEVCVHIAGYAIHMANFVFHMPFPQHIPILAQTRSVYGFPCLFLIRSLTKQYRSDVGIARDHVHDRVETMVGVQLENKWVRIVPGVIPLSSMDKVVHLGDTMELMNN
jgi:hypothetical protein